MSFFDSFSPLKQLSPDTNGFIIRLVGRCRISDGLLHLLQLVLLLPLTVVQLVHARVSRGSWEEVWFQVFSRGNFSAGIPRDRTIKIQNSEPVYGQSEGQHLKLVCMSDTHCCHKWLEPIPDGDVLVHCGDFTSHGSLEEVKRFADWFGSQPHSTKLLVPGNHDMILHKEYYDNFWSDWSSKKESHEEAVKVLTDKNIKILVDETVYIHGVKFHGSPWVTQHHSWSTAFNKSEEGMGNHWRLLPPGIDVLLTHMPPYGMGDREAFGHHHGCPHLALKVAEVKPKIHVFGHVHGDHGIFKRDHYPTTFVNATSVCDYYWVGKREPIVIEIPCSKN
eukprot:TRINITY_DN79492_c0_g1_i1.p1 TRINITY_DN79492_c0_g1~~TRINITY_DN79492_c0_g1_i1.p1  ORF type:complete len:334 (-),score=36.19 TRINITY_DN79492_c0_g1_i1:43-1044(-)